MANDHLLYKQVVSSKSLSVTHGSHSTFKGLQ